MVKKFNLLLLLILSFSLKSASQETYSNFHSVDVERIFDDFSNFRCSKFCSDTILVTKLSRINMSYEYTIDEYKKWLYKNYYSPSSEFQISSVVNDGYVIVISQFPKSNQIPIRFFTLFLSVQTGKIVVVEVEENK
jgi:hypothetical protein